jgi:hypothetical protein
MINVFSDAGLTNYSGGLPDPEKEAIRWQAYKDTVNALKTHTINGMTLQQIGLNSLMGDDWTPEAEELDYDTFGNGDLPSIVYGQNLYYLAFSVVKNLAQGPGVYRVIKDGNKGFSTFISRMLTEFQSLGGRIFFNHEMTGFYESGSRYLLNFANGAFTRSKHIILNTPKNSIIKLDPESLLFKAAPLTTKKAWGSLYQIKGAKIYLHYPEAWWFNRGWTSGSIITTSWLKEMRYHDAPIWCQGLNHTDCQGFFQAAFVLGQQSYHFDQIHKNTLLRTNTPYSVLRRANDAKAAYYLDMIHAEVMRAHRHLVDPADIPVPDYGVVSNWASNDYMQCGAIPGMNDLQAGTQGELMLRPIPGERVFVANVDFSSKAGWAESSVEAAEKVLQRYFGIAKPSWISESWYDANIRFIE